MEKRAGTGELIQFRLETKAFDLAVKRFVRLYGDSAENSVKKIGFELQRRTVNRTSRVDTGRMKNSWHTSFHRPSNWVPSENDPVERKPDPGVDKLVRTLFIQSNLHYTPHHEFGANLRGGRKLSPLLMLTKSVQELSGEMVQYLLSRMEPLWNKEINGITGAGLTAEAKVRKADFIKSLPGLKAAYRKSQRKKRRRNRG